MTEVPTIQKISPLFSRVNQWAGFYIIGTSVTKELNLRLKKMIFEGILFPYFQHSAPKQEVHFPRKCVFFQITLSGMFYCKSSACSSVLFQVEHMFGSNFLKIFENSQKIQH